MTFVPTALLVFLAVTTAVVAVYQLLVPLLFPEAARVRQRLEEEHGGKPEAAVRAPLFRPLDRVDLDGPPGSFNPEEAATARPSRGWRDRLQVLLDQADLDLSVERLLLLSGLTGAGFAVAGFAFLGVVAGILAAAVGAAVPFALVEAKRRLRREAFLARLPTAFDLMARVIRSGQSPQQAFQAVADAIDGPLGQEFAACQKRQHLGLRPEVACREMAERTGVLEMRIFVMALLIHRQTGGNLSDVLERLAELLRARQRLRRQVRTLTAEGRLQGWTLAALPIVMFVALRVINAEYADVLFQHPGLLIATGAAMLVGLLWIRSIINFEV